MEDNGFVLKVNMPMSIYKDFINDAKEHYNNSYWYKIVMEEKLYRILYSYQPQEVIDKIEDLRLELLQLIEEKYERGRQDGWK